MNDLDPTGPNFGTSHFGRHGTRGLDRLPLDTLIDGDNVAGDILVAQGTPPTFQRLATGASGTVFIGGSTFSANLLITGYSRIGSTTAPTNVTAGDLTAVRILAGNATLASGVVAAFTGNETTTGWTRVGSATAPTNTTAGDLTAVRVLAGDATLASGVVAAFAGNQTTTGWLNVGVATAPSNTTAGDLTALRAHIGTDGAFSAGKELEVTGDALVSSELQIGGPLNHDGAAVGFYTATPTSQQASGANLTNNVTVGGTNDTIANYTDLVTYANDAAAIRNDIYQLARKVKQVNDALRLYGLLT